MCLEAGADFLKESTLLKASREGHAEIVKLLLRHGATHEANKTGQIPLYELLYDDTLRLGRPCLRMAPHMNPTCLTEHRCGLLAV